MYVIWTSTVTVIAAQFVRGYGIILKKCTDDVIYKCHYSVFNTPQTVFYRLKDERIELSERYHLVFELPEVYP